MKINLRKSDNEEWQLATTLKDKKGKRIFQGDLLELKTGEQVIVDFNGLAFVLLYQDGETVAIYDDEHKGSFLDFTETRIVG